MLTFDTTTNAALASAASKEDWCNIIKTNLGNPRILICKRAASGDAWATGTTFRDVDLTGVVTVSGAVISNFGVSSNARVKLAADLATGVSVWRISNAAGTRWIQGSLGLVGSGADIERSANPTTNDGDDVALVNILPPGFLSSGRGPASPPWNSNTPKYVVFDPYVDGAFVNGEGDPDTDVEFDDRGPDWVATHDFLASQLGDVAWWSCTNPIKVGVHEAYPQLFRHHAGCTQSGDRPLEAIWISARPVNEEPGDWSTFPARGTGTTVVYDRKNPRHSTYFAPGRFRYLNDQRVEIGRSEWSGGRPINDPAAPQDEFYDTTTGTAVPASSYSPVMGTVGGVVRQVGWSSTGAKWGDTGVKIDPHWNIAQPILWENEIPAYMDKELYAGVEDDAMVEYMNKNQNGFNPLNFLAVRTGGQADNIYNPWVNAWEPQSKEEHPRLEPIDPYAGTPNVTSRPYQPWFTGISYYPGANGGQDVYSGPGGMREDRSAIALRIARLVTDQDGVRLEGAIPHRDWAWNWCKNYANLARTFVTDRKLGSIPKSESLQGLWRQNTGYYGPGPTTDLRYKVDYVAIGNQGNKQTKDYTLGMTAEQWKAVSTHDSTGRHPYGYQLPESELHGYAAPAQALLAFRDARFAIMQRFFFDTAWMARLGSSTPLKDPVGYYGQRIHAWRWTDYLWAWMSAAEHPLSYNRTQIEDRMQIELEKINTDVYEPAFVNNGGQGDPTLFAQGVRRFGQPMVDEETSGFHFAKEIGGSKFYYLGLACMLMKTTGMWDVMKNKSPGCANALFCTIHSLAKGSIDWALGTETKWTMYYGTPQNIGGHMAASRMDLPATVSVTDLADSWADAATTLPDPGQANFWKLSDGTHIVSEDPPIHARAQWPSIHKLFFATDYPWTGIDEALDMYRNFYLERNAYALTKSAPNFQRDANWKFRMASYGFVKPVE